MMNRRGVFLGAALAASSAFAAHAGPDGSIPDPDGYHKLATAALKFKTLATPDGAPTAVRDPLFTLLLAGLYFVFGPSYGLILTMNVLLGVGLTLLVWRLGERLFGRSI